jgi:hypothetical protein
VEQIDQCPTPIMPAASLCSCLKDVAHAEYAHQLDAIARRRCAERPQKPRWCSEKKQPPPQAHNNENGKKISKLRPGACGLRRPHDFSSLRTGGRGDTDATARPTGTRPTSGPNAMTMASPITSPMSGAPGFASPVVMSSAVAAEGA